ncbi:trypsin-1-like [Eriocheir sinensis]|uniref:trypsin-1-like n=1 Tax=Eriocheir sinensis TaxID=95602 RepID=UPI0021C67768|nr:trypsin-1-like [Eriocheir sinensis]
MLRTLVLAGVVSVCGGSALRGAPRGRILSGTEATPLQFPFLVFLRVGKPNVTFVCGGILLDVQRVLTAAHCLDDVQQPQDITAVAGEHDFVTEEGEEQTRVVEAMWTHNHFQGDPKLAADLAILEVLEPFVLAGSLKTAPLADEEPVDGTVCTAAGWGTTAEFGEVSPVLLTADLTVVKRSRCRETIVTHRPTAIVDESVICAGGDGVHDTCEGDSGGPLVCEGVVAGMVSWGVGCGHFGVPAVYTSVPHWRDWIAAHQNATSDPASQLLIPTQQNMTLT